MISNEFYSLTFVLFDLCSILYCLILFYNDHISSPPQGSPYFKNKQIGEQFAVIY